MNLSPLYISLKVSLIATVLTFFLGIAAARWVVKIRHGKAFVDGFFTLPMILPPTVAGFFLLLVFGRNSLIGQFWDCLMSRLFLPGFCGHRIDGGVVSADVPNRERSFGRNRFGHDFCSKNARGRRKSDIPKNCFAEYCSQYHGRYDSRVCAGFGRIRRNDHACGQYSGQNANDGGCRLYGRSGGQLYVGVPMGCDITVMSFTAMFLMNFINQHYI